MGPDAEILWEVAQVLAREAAEVSGAPRRALPPLLFFTDPVRTPRPWETAERLPAGAGVVYRHFGATDALETALRLRDVTARRDLRLLIGLDAGLADAVGADGVHLPERALDQAAGLAKAQPHWLLTGAAHGAAALVHTVPLDAVVISPVFAAGGVSSLTSALGLPAFIALVHVAPVPVYALGGINTQTARSLVGSGACGLAGVSAIQSAIGG